METTTRNNVEAAIGAIITRHSDVEAALIDLIQYLIGDQRKGEIVGWLLSFSDKIRVVKALAKDEPRITDDWVARLEKALSTAEQTASKLRNIVAHGELWSNPEDDTYAIRKGRKNSKNGIEISHEDCDIDALWVEAKRLEELAFDIRSVSVVFMFEPVESLA